jgi:hypothetical protein
MNLSYFAKVHFGVKGDFSYLIKCIGKIRNTKNMQFMYRLSHLSPILLSSGLHISVKCIEKIPVELPKQQEKRRYIRVNMHDYVFVTLRHTFLSEEWCHLMNAHAVVFVAVVVGAIMVQRSECAWRVYLLFGERPRRSALAPSNARIHPPLFLPCPRVHFNDQQTASPTLFLLTRNSAISRRRDKLWVPLWLGGNGRNIYRSNKICIAREETQYKYIFTLLFRMYCMRKRSLAADFFWLIKIYNRAAAIVIQRYVRFAVE